MRLRYVSIGGRHCIRGCLLLLCFVVFISHWFLHKLTEVVGANSSRDTAFLEAHTSNKPSSHALDASSCDSSWGIFKRNQSTLTETQVIHRSPSHSRPPLDIDGMDERAFRGLFIDPASNFAFCAIEKNACSQWFTVLRNVMDNRVDNGHAKSAHGLWRQTQQKHGRAKMKEIYESPTSTVVVMVRDPLARFASVYLNKCFDLNCSSGFCNPRPKESKGRPIPFRQAIDWVLRDSVNVSKVELHWRLQSTRCGIENGGLDKYFTIVGKMGSKETLSHDAACIMEQAGIGRYNIAIAGNNGTFWGSGGMKMRKYRKESEEDLLRKLFTPETAQKVMAKYKQDYETFQLPEPDWIKHATGEWMDRVDHHECKDRAW